MREFDTGATRDTDEDKLDYEGLLSPLALERYAQYLHAHRKQADGKMRDSDNWQKGLPIKECVKSMIRHVVDIWKLNRGYSVVDQRDGHFISMEEALCANIFNSFSILDTLEKPKHRVFESTPKEEPNPYSEEWEKAKATALSHPGSTCAPSSFPPTQYGGDE